MSAVATLLGAVSTALLAATLAGLVVRGRWGQWYAFTAYAALNGSFSLAVLLWPEVFYVEYSWTLQQNVLNAVRFAVALELAVRTFYSFPGARSTLRGVILAVLGVTLIVVAPAAWGNADYRSFLEELQPRLLNGAVWLFTAIAALILWYRLPVAALHKGILLGYVPYLLFQLVYLRVFVARSWQLPILGYLNQGAYLLLVTYWAWVAWRAEAPVRTHGKGPHGEEDPQESSLARAMAG